MWKEGSQDMCRNDELQKREMRMHKMSQYKSIKNYFLVCLGTENQLFKRICTSLIGYRK